ncbi:MAG: hypothetical protein SFV54_25930 [Bryobacteraceae bacterium]|nr:hypothetical protein [Bryobacteraceae bacterium]
MCGEPAHLLAVISLDQGDRAAALHHFRLYLKHAPKAADAGQVKAQIAELEAALKGWY